MDIQTDTDEGSRWYFLTLFIPYCIVRNYTVFKTVFFLDCESTRLIYGARIQQDGQSIPGNIVLRHSVPILRWVENLNAALWIVTRVRAARRMKILNISFPRVRIEPITFTVARLCPREIVVWMELLNIFNIIGPKN